MTYTIVDVTPDTPEWEQERRNSIGASDVPAILGLSPWGTPLSVYRAKMGVPDDFDPELAFIGHEEERTMENWILKFRTADIPRVLPPFMARSREYPWLHASFDRLADHEGLLAPIQMKTAHQYTGKDWENGIPLVVQAQIQAEILVLDAPFGWAVVFVGGRKFYLRRVERDDKFINEYLLPETERFWTEHVQAGVAPEPSTFAEVAEVWPSEPGTSIPGSELVLEAADRRAVLLSDAKALKDEADALTLAIAQYMQTAEVLTDPTGAPVLSYKTQQGRRTVTDLDALEQAHPEFVKRGAPFKVMRHLSLKEKKSD